MVSLGRIPDQVDAPFLSIVPAIRGSFRWAGPTILVFTPAADLPHATTYRVTVAGGAAGAKAVSGRTLARTYSFTFTTPTVRLLRTEWYREGDRFDRPVKIVLRFNQPVRAADVLAHAALNYQPHDWEVPGLDARQRQRMGPLAVAAFERKVNLANAVARSTAPVPFVVAAEWDRERYKPDPAMVVLQTTTAPSPGGFLELVLDRQLPGVEGSATPPAQQTYTIQLAPAFFAHNFRCQRQCDADAFNSARLTGPVDIAALRQAVTVRDVTAAPETRVEAGGERPVSTDVQGPDLLAESRGAWLQPPAAVADLCHRPRPLASGRRRTGARLRLRGRRRKLAHARVHQLRRRPRRLGAERRTRCCRSTPAT